MKPINLPADLVHAWAAKHAADSAKLEGRELPDGFIRSVQAQQFLNMRRGSQSVKPVVVTWPDTDYSMVA